jgi:hypothetical protein
VDDSKHEKSTIERDYPGMMLIVLGVFFVLVAVDARSLGVLWFGLILMFAGVYLGRINRRD